MSSEAAQPVTGRLPPEICDYVLDCLWNDHDTLAACSLVHREWLPTTRLHMFRAISINRRDHIRLGKLFSESPYLAKYVRRVVIDVAYKSRLMAVTEILLILDHVEDLMLRNWLAHDYSLEDTIAPHFRNIKSLQLIGPDVEPKNLFRLLCMCPKLVALQVQNALLWNTTTIYPDTPLPPDLVAITPRQPIVLHTFKADHIECLLFAWLLRGPLEMRPEKLHLSWTPPHEINPDSDQSVSMWIPETLRTIGPSLKHLVLSPTCSFLIESHGLGLASNTSLETVHLDITYLFAMRAEWVGDVLAKIRSDALRRVEFGFHFDPANVETFRDALEWESIDHSLARLARDRPNLEVKILVLSLSNELTAVLYDCLKKLRREKCRFGVVSDARYIADVVGDDPETVEPHTEERWFALPD